MKRTRLNRLGKIGKRNIASNKVLKDMYLGKGITRCEIGFGGCLRDNFLSFAHRHKRIWYRNKDRQYLLSDFKQTVLACVSCHNKIEYDKGITDSVFRALRGEEII